MDVKSVALKMGKIVENATNLVDYHPEYGADHIMDMCCAIVNGEVIGEKAHRWLGWIQGCLCMSGEISLEELKEINKGECADCGNCNCKK